MSITSNLFIEKIDFVPISALKGDMVVQRGNKMPWYDGPTLIEILESAKLNIIDYEGSIRFPVQLVNRVDNNKRKDFRGYMGRSLSGKISVGNEIKILPTNKTSKVRELILSSKNSSKK